MINLFSLIAGQVRHREDLFDDEGKIMEALLNSGYRLHEADAALTLMQTLVHKENEQFFGLDRGAAPCSIRSMTREERARFSVEAFGFLSKLAHLGIISEELREELIDRAMTVYMDRIEFEHVKALIAFTLFTSPLERDHAAQASLRRIQDTSWN